MQVTIATRQAWLSLGLYHTLNKTPFCSVKLTYHQFFRLKEKKHLRSFVELTLVTFKVPVQSRVRHINLSPCSW